MKSTLFKQAENKKSIRTLIAITLLLPILGILSSCGDSDDNDETTKEETTADESTATGSTATGSTAEKSFIFPFRTGESWTVCQGYNTDDLTHAGDLNYSLDLSIDPESAKGSFGCNFSTATKSIGYKVVAPAKAKILWEGLTLGLSSDVACLQLDTAATNGANSVLLGHMTLDGLTAGDAVSMGQEIGTVNEASVFNGGYSHIHISMYKSVTCQGESIDLEKVFGDGYDFSNDGSKQQWRGTVVKR